MFINLNEYYYERGIYFTRSLAVNTDEISDIFETNSSYIDSVRITMKNGNIHDVKESYKEIMEKINT